MRCSFPAQCHFGAIHAIDARFATGSAASWNNDVAGKEAQFHQAAGDVFRQIQAIKHTRLSLREAVRAYAQSCRLAQRLVRC